MSIYATLWCLKFPKFGDYYKGCQWIEVWAQGVPSHIGSPTPGCGYEEGDPYATFLPPAIEAQPNDLSLSFMRAMVFVTSESRKGTERSHQEYMDPLLVLTGEEYAIMPLDDLHEKLCTALRRNHPRLILQKFGADGKMDLIFEDGSQETVSGDS
jgi:hypothetical protein